MSIKLVVWDWNGTLFDDTQAVVIAANKSEVPALGLKPITVEQMRESYEVPIIRAYENLGVDPAVFTARSAEIAPIFHKIYEPLAAKARTRIGARETLRTLHRAGYTSIILSNHTVEGIYFQLTRLDLGEYFEDVLANDSLGSAHHNGKQHRLEAYLEKNAYEPSRVVIVGDTLEEIRIGSSLGIRTISVGGGICSTSRLEKAKPDYLVSSVKQVVNIVERIV